MTQQRDREPDRTCLACGSPARAAADRLRVPTAAGGAGAAYARCPSCGLLYLDPMPSPDELAACYDEAYYGYGRTKFYGAVDALRGLCLRRRARRLASMLDRRPARVLDVGAGDGRFLKGMRALGCEVFGTERPGPAFERAARIAGVNMVAGDVCEAGFDPGSFDLVTLWHVLEHLPDPFAAVQCCSRLLRDDGLLVVEVPNLESWQSRAAGVMAFHLDPPRHVLQFTSAALQALCARNGLSCCRRETASLEMGVLGAAQGWMNLVIRPRDLFYDILRTRNRCAGSAPAKALSLALAVPLLPAALAFTVLEAACGHGPVLRCFFRRAHRR